MATPNNRGARGTPWEFCNVCQKYTSRDKKGDCNDCKRRNPDPIEVPAATSDEVIRAAASRAGMRLAAKAASSLETATMTTETGSVRIHVPTSPVPEIPGLVPGLEPSSMVHIEQL